MRMSIKPRAAVLLSAVAVAAFATLWGLLAATQAATVPETVAYGNQSGQPGAPNFALFGLLATGNGTAATGHVSFFVGSPTPKYVTGTVTCMNITGNTRW